MVDDAILATIVQRTLAVFPDARILLFGSRANGTARADSDYDIAIVAARARPGRGPAAELRLSLYGLGVSLDLVFATPEEWVAMSAVGNSLAADAQATGRVLHEAA